MSSTQQSHRVLLLGATKGIGFALARQLGAENHHITLTGRSQASLDEALSRLHAGNPAGHFDGFALDLKDHVPRATPLATPGLSIIWSFAAARMRPGGHSRR